MFIRHANYHPYKRSAAPSPAGFRIADYLNPKRCFNLFQGPDFTNDCSPAPSPLSSPVRGSRHPKDDPSPTICLADLLKGNGLESPHRPRNSMADHLRDVTPNGQTTNEVPEEVPLPVPPRRRKVKHGPKHLSFSNVAPHPGLVPPRRRTQQLKEKRDAARRRVLDRHERRVARAREKISDLRKEADALMKPEHMSEEDKIFLKQLEALQLDQVLKHDLEQVRQRVTRAAGESPDRRQEHKERDEQAAKMWSEGRDEEAQEEQKRKVEAFVQAKEERREAGYRRMEEAAMRADEERQRAHEALERTIREAQERLFRDELTRKAQEEKRRRRREQERRMREERERRIREERERRIREERERRRQEDRERMLREEVERLRREVHERFLREQRERRAREERERLVREERERQARLLAEQARRTAREDEERQYFILYEAKWNELRANNALPLIDVREIPWPVFSVVSSANQITYQDVRTFLLHPLRPGMEGKTARDKVKSEVLRFHPDKFNARVVPKIQPSQQAIAQEIAGVVARILTSIMTEEVEEQK